VNSLITAASPKHSIRFQIQGLSLLARNFNTLWASAWEKQADYLVMLHSDIGIRAPEGFSGSWLDAMVERIEESKAAVLSVVVPIKNQIGHTSTALQLEKGNSFKLRRVVIKDLPKLPMKWICRDDLCELYQVSPEVAGPLFVNTGCMIMNLKKFPWAKERWPGFEIRDILAWSLDGIPKPYTVPEDWKLSQWLFEKGWPYYATREFVVAHIGSTPYNNNGEWGCDQDLEGETWSSIREYENSKVLPPGGMTLT
jgi:hypothetical protein